MIMRKERVGRGSEIDETAAGGGCAATTPGRSAEIGESSAAAWVYTSGAAHPLPRAPAMPPCAMPPFYTGCHLPSLVPLISMNPKNYTGCFFAFSY